MHKRICRACGQEFIANTSNVVFCSYACRMATSRDPAPRAGKDRAFTELTPYLCQKWQREGMCVTKIAEILNRTQANVEQALLVRLSRGQEAAIKEYFHPKRKRPPMTTERHRDADDTFSGREL